jgi:hypothetical protein
MGTSNAGAIKQRLHQTPMSQAEANLTLQLFNFVIAKITPLMLADITYGTFLLFGSCCIVMGIYTIFCVPETKNVPLESIHLLFEGDIIKGCIRDTVPRHSRAKKLQHHHVTNDQDSDDDGKPGHKRTVTAVQHIEDA